MPWLGQSNVYNRFPAAAMLRAAFHPAKALMPDWIPPIVRQELDAENRREN